MLPDSGLTQFQAERATYQNLPQLTHHRPRRNIRKRHAEWIQLQFDEYSRIFCRRDYCLLGNACEVIAQLKNNFGANGNAILLT